MTGRRPQEANDPAIHDVSAWILRVGVIVSVSTMLLGVALRFAKGVPELAELQTARFDPDFAAVFSRAAAGDGLALLHVGILLLVATPILRVASSMVIFAVFEKDRLYATVTALVLAMTLLSLFVLR